MKDRKSIISRFAESFQCFMWNIRIIPRCSLNGSQQPGKKYAQSLVINTARLISELPHLSYQNCHGADIYCRPEEMSREEIQWIFLDDIASGRANELRSMGSSAIVGTSPNNLQAWFTLSTPVSRFHAVEITRSLCKYFGGDLHSADNPRQDGRLPGFTNHKPAYLIEGRRPLCWLVWAKKQRVETAKLMPRSTSRASSTAADTSTDTSGTRQFSTDFHQVRKLLEMGRSDQATISWLMENSVHLPGNRYYAEKTIRRALRKHT